MLKDYKLNNSVIPIDKYIITEVFFMYKVVSFILHHGGLPPYHRHPVYLTLAYANILGSNCPGMSRTVLDWLTLSCVLDSPAICPGCRS